MTLLPRILLLSGVWMDAQANDSMLGESAFIPRGGLGNRDSHDEPEFRSTNSSLAQLTQAAPSTHASMHSQPGDSVLEDVPALFSSAVWTDARTCCCGRPLAITSASFLRMAT